MPMIWVRKDLVVLEERDYQPQKIVSFKIYPYELEDLDRKIKEMGFRSRSEFIRAAIRFALRHYEEFRRELPKLIW